MAKSTNTNGESSQKRILRTVLICVATYCLVAFTPLRLTIPGYPSKKTRLMAMDNLVKIDSLERVINMWSFQMSNIQRVLNGLEPTDPEARQEKSAEEFAFDDSRRQLYTAGDSLLRAEVNRQERLSATYGRKAIPQIEGRHFFTPLTGVITKEFDRASGSYDMEISAPEGTVIYAPLDGTVIASALDKDGRGTITLQHEGETVSIFRGTGRLLKGTGDKGKAGTALGLAADPEEGGLLSFELWHEGEAMDPALYIKF